MGAICLDVGGSVFVCATTTKVALEKNVIEKNINPNKDYLKI